MTFDLKVINGQVVDGTGVPPYRSDVAVTNGRIVGLGGDADGRADRVIDADGQVVCPGFVDIHTHLDAQVLWDPMASVSSWHGVTTVVAGNCGFGFAPTRREHRETVLQTLENVEGMDVDCLKAGLGDWGFETYPEYLDAIDRRGVAVNFAGLVPHSTLRLFVMGDDASTRAARPDEVDAMAELLRQALQAGAVGFSTSRHPGHSGAGGLPVPSRLAEFSEIERMATVMGEEHRGVFMAAIGKGFTIPELKRIAASSGRPVTFASIVVGMAGVDGHRRLLERTEQAQEEGYEIIAQFSCLPVTVEFSLRNPFFLGESMPAAIGQPVLRREFAEALVEQSVTGRLAIYRHSDFQAAFEPATSTPVWDERIWSKVLINDVPGHPELTNRLLVDYARERMLSPARAVIELSIESDLEAGFLTVLHNNDEVEVERLLLHPGTQLGLSDAGAHTSQLCDACYPSHLLGHWVRRKQALSFEAAVKMMTSDPAALYRLDGRGVVALGAAADLVVMDPDTVGTGARETRRDLPAGSPRVVIPPVGVDCVIVGGTPIREGNQDVVESGSLPGRVLRPAR